MLIGSLNTTGWINLRMKGKKVWILKINFYIFFPSTIISSFPLCISDFFCLPLSFFQSGFLHLVDRIRATMNFSGSCFSIRKGFKFVISVSIFPRWDEIRLVSLSSTWSKSLCPVRTTNPQECCNWNRATIFEKYLASKTRDSVRLSLDTNECFQQLKFSAYTP